MRGGFLLDGLEHSPAGWTARARVPDDAPVFAGHFPGRPVVPGIALLLVVADLDGTSRVPVRLRGVRFRVPVGPGASLVVTLEGERFTLRDGDTMAVEGRMTLARAEDVLAPALPGPAGTLAPPLLPHAEPARLVTACGGGRAIARVPASSPLALDGRVPACVALEAAAQGAQGGEGAIEGTGLLVAVTEASFPPGLIPVETPFEVRVQPDGAAPPLHRFRARAELGGAWAEAAFAVVVSA